MADSIATFFHEYFDFRISQSELTSKLFMLEVKRKKDFLKKVTTVVIYFLLLTGMYEFFTTRERVQKLPQILAVEVTW